MDFKELMDAFAEDAGMSEPIAYEADDLCHLDINDRDFGFRYVAEAGRLVIWTSICERPPESGEALLVQLLRANFVGRGCPDGALSLSDDDVITAHCTLRLPVYDKDEFYDLLRRFVSVADEWRTMIEFAGRVDAGIREIRPETSPAPSNEMRIDG